VRELSNVFGYSRQNYYKHAKITANYEVLKQKVVSFVREARKEQPKVGFRKLYLSLNSANIRVGRDKLLEILRNKNLLIKRRKNYRITTDSNHNYKRYKNLIKDNLPKRPDEQYVSDITYIETAEGWSYVRLITDRYSRKIKGWSITRDLTVEGNIEALKMLERNRRIKRRGAIHHSDQGKQYCCGKYTKLLTRFGMKISMTEEDHVYENAMAERVNGILKQEFGLGGRLPSHEVAKKMLNQAIKVYNEKRLHMAIEYQIPEEFDKKMCQLF